MTERSPLKQRDASEAQGGSARDRLARARRRANEPAREDGDAEGAARATAAAPAAASDDEDEREDADEEGGGREGGESRDTAVAVPVSRARSPGRFGLGGLLKGRKRSAPADAGDSGGGGGGEEEEGGES